MLLQNIALKELVPFINWSYFFAAWNLGGRFPDIFNHPEKGVQAKELYDDAQQLLTKIIADKLLQARAVAEILPANSEKEDIIIYTNSSRTSIRKHLPQLRNQEAKQGTPNLCLADFIMPSSSLSADHIGLFALSSGFGLSELICTFKAAHDDYNAIMAKALADRLTEACAAWLHWKVYQEYARTTEKNPCELVGIRPAIGYPACPDHSMKADILELLQSTENIGLQLTESYMMMPESSVCGFIFFRPQASYFSVGKIDAEQLANYAARRGMTVAQIKRLMPENVA